MTRLREEFDADSEATKFSDVPDAEHRFELVCSECGKTVFTDEATHGRFVRALELDPDNQFVCDDCGELTEELAHSAA